LATGNFFAKGSVQICAYLETKEEEAETMSEENDVRANESSKVELSADAASRCDVPKKIANAQTVCNERNEKGKLCNGFLKQINTGGQEAAKHLQGDDVLFKCQMCGALYVGPPLGHLRDPKKQTRFVQNELTALLEAAGGTLPAIVKDERGVYVLKDDPKRDASSTKTNE
jgi:hypothetical protein